MAETGDRIEADRRVNTLYGTLRGRYGDAKANGYVTQSYFERERETLMALIDPGAGLVIDVGCGSGLMIAPLVAAGHAALGIDFNEDACRAAAAADIPIVRGDAYRMPFAGDCAATMINTQFLNQQTPDDAGQLLAEIGRVLRPGGTAIIVWRNGPALVHRLSLLVLGALGKLRGLPSFPMVDHSLADVVAQATRAGLTLRDSFLTFPPLRLTFERGDSIGGRLLGASYYALFSKPGGT